MKFLTIIQETRSGMLAEITTMLENQGINLLSIDGSTVGTLAVINLCAEPYEVCLETLQDAGFRVFANEQLLIRTQDKPGALADISRKLANREVDILSIHIVGREGDGAIIALETANDYSAKQVLRDMLVR